MNKMIWIMLIVASSLACCSCYTSGNWFPKKEIHLKDLEIHAEKSSTRSVPRGTRGRLPAVDQKVLDFLGAERVAIIHAIERVEAYQIDRTGNSGNVIQGYPVSPRIRNLNQRQIKAVQAIICTAGSYEFEWHKRTRLRPSHILRFIQKNKVVDIAMDFNSRQWGFYYKGECIEEDISEKSAMPVLWKIMESLW